MLLLAVFGLPLVSSSLALGQDPEAGLPACCRRSGQHHCAMTMAARAQMAASTSDEHRWERPVEQCPYCPARVAAAHFDPSVVPLHADVLRYAHGPAARVWNAECRRRVSRDGARQKRGPPALFLA